MIVIHTNVNNTTNCINKLETITSIRTLSRDAGLQVGDAAARRLKYDII